MGGRGAPQPASGVASASTTIASGPHPAITRSARCVVAITPVTSGDHTFEAVDGDRGSPVAAGLILAQSERLRGPAGGRASALLRERSRQTRPATAAGRARGSRGIGAPDAPRARVPLAEASQSAHPLGDWPPLGRDRVIRTVVGGAREPSPHTWPRRDHRALRRLRRRRGDGPAQRRCRSRRVAGR